METLTQGCVKEYNFCGALLAGQYQGHFYDEKNFFPIFESAAKLDVPLSFHPAPINKIIQDYYYKSPEFSPFITGQISSAGLGWHIDVGIHEIRLILAGIFERLPNLKIIAGHWGETIIPYLDRIDSILKRKTTGLLLLVLTFLVRNAAAGLAGGLAGGLAFAAAALFRALAKIPGVQRFNVLHDGFLRPQISTAILP